MGINLAYDRHGYSFCCCHFIVLVSFHSLSRYQQSATNLWCMTVDITSPATIFQLIQLDTSDQSPFAQSECANIIFVAVFFFHLFIIIMGFLWKKSLCNLIGIFRNLLITRVEFLFIRSFSWYFAFYMDARNCVVCYIHSRVIIVELRCNLRIIGRINNCHLRLSCHFLHIISAILHNSIRFSEKLKENQMH